ncbi:MAG: OmpA family protein, partial [Nitrococcus sp.]|nr:OmpA family protein [Nitrococcus sp.]
DSAELSAAADAPLDKLASFLREHPSYRVRVEGYTDSVGPMAYNQRLSERRAQSVADAMTARGIASGRMTVAGYGEANPVAPNNTAAGRARNRRVEFVILGAGVPEVTSEPQANIR